MGVLSGLFTFPPRSRVLRLAGAAAGLTILGMAAFFVWFDQWFALSHSLGALEAMNDSAYRLQAKGDYAEAARLLRASVVIQERRAFHDPFGVEDWLRLATRQELAIVLAKAHKARGANEAEDALLEDAALTYGVHSADYAQIALNRGRIQELLDRKAKP